MKIVVAPDSFKECLPSGEVASAVVSAIREIMPDSTACPVPLSDGGEGMLDVVTEALGGRIVPVEVSGPLGKRVAARLGVAGETAVVEVAEACGLQLLRSNERHPLRTTTYGVGELLLCARKLGCTHMMVGLGGSSTCDGGAGMMAVPLIREALSDVSMEILCDVDAPFTGPLGAARVFGPQKGADPAEVEILERRMQERARQICIETGTDVSLLPGAGAAGGLGGALLAYFGATIRRGIDRILDLVDFDRAVDGADLVITGEGRSDRQTLAGKVALGVLHRSGTVPVALLSGRIEDRQALQEAGFRFLVEVSPRGMSLSEAMLPEVARHNLRLAVAALLRQFS